MSNVWDNIVSKARDTAELVGKKTEDFVGMTKLKLALSDTEKEIRETMEGLGRLVYDAQKSGEDVSELVAAAVATADELQAKADDLRAQVYAAKKLQKCPHCDTVNAEDAVYCKSCGQKITE